jgi:hypothetical protein
MNPVEQPHFTTPEQSLADQWTGMEDAGKPPEKLIGLECIGMAPTLEEVASDPSRTNPIELTYLDKNEGKKLKTVKTEQQMVADLATTFKTLISNESAIQGISEKDDSTLNELVQSAKDLLAETSYIGEKERHEATTTIAKSWKDYLKNNPEGRLYVLAPISDFKNLEKSDRFIRNEILGNFTTEELAEFEDRLTPCPVSEVPNNLGEKDRIVAVDDWILSGEQMRKALRYLHETNPSSIQKTELHLLAAPEDLLADGFSFHINGTIQDEGNTANVPVKSAFLSRTMSDPMVNGVDRYVTRITGSHSSTDALFSMPALEIAYTLQDHRLIPPELGAIDIKRPYRTGDTDVYGGSILHFS